MRSRDIETFKKEEGIEETIRVLGVNSRQVMYNKIKAEGDIQIIERDGLIMAMLSKTINVVPARDKED